MDVSQKTPEAAARARRKAAAWAAFAGLGSQVVQIVMFRELLAACRGTELFIGLVMASGLLWAAAGSLLARGQLGRCRGPSPGDRGLLPVGLSLGAVSTLQVAAVRCGAAWLAGPGTLGIWSCMGLALLAPAPAAAAFGWLFAVAVHQVPEEDFGRIYQAEAAGAVVGGLACTFLLAGRLPPVPLLWLLAGVGGTALCWQHRSRWGGVLALGCLCLGAGALLLDADLLLHRLGWGLRQPGAEVAMVRDSRAGRIAALKRGSPAQFSLYQDGELVEAVMPGASDALGDRALALLVAAQHPTPSGALLIGRTVGPLPQAFLDAGLARLIALESDAAIAEVACDLDLGSADSPRIARHSVDARRFVQGLTTGTLLDLIVVFPPAPSSLAANRLCTIEFLRECRQALGPDGVLAIAVPGADAYLGEALRSLAATVRRTLGEVFAEVAMVPGSQVLFLAARRPGTLSLDPEVLALRVLQRGPYPRDLCPDPDVPEPSCLAAWFANLVDSYQAAALKAAIEDTPAEVNRDGYPVACRAALLAWNDLVSADPEARDPGLDRGPSRLLRWALSTRARHVAIALALAGCLSLALWLWRLRSRRQPGARGDRALARLALLGAAAGTGFFGMAMATVLIYALQCLHGHVYVLAGALSSCFMAGLALGARSARRWRPGLAQWLFLLEGLAACALATAVATRLLAAGPWGTPVVLSVFAGLTLAAGVLDGVAFALLARNGTAWGIRRAGTWVYGADLAGAALGAVVVGTVLVPCLGQDGALVTVAVVSVLALLPLGVER